MEGNCSTCRNTRLSWFYWPRLSTTPTILAQAQAKMRALVVCLVASASTETVYLLVPVTVAQLWAVCWVAIGLETLDELPSLSSYEAL